MQPVQPAVGQRAVRVIQCGVYGNAGRLVQHGGKRILIGDGKQHRLRYNACLPLGREREADTLAGMHRLVRADGAVIGKKAVSVILDGFDQPGRDPLHPQKKSQSAAIVFRRHGIAQNGHSAALLKAYLRVLYHKTAPYANPNVWNGARKKSAHQKTALPQESCPCYFCDCLSSAARSSTGLRYCPVKESGFCATFSGVPVATMVPPPLPPSGPRSMI